MNNPWILPIWESQPSNFEILSWCAWWKSIFHASTIFASQYRISWFSSSIRVITLFLWNSVERIMFFARYLKYWIESCSLSKSHYWILRYSNHIRIVSTCTLFARCILIGCLNISKHINNTLAKRVIESDIWLTKICTCKACLLMARVTSL